MNGSAENSTDLFDLKAAAALPPEILFGTSTWSYPGWKGLVYNQNYRDEQDFKARCLAEYAAFPWFRTVCIDSAFYRPPTPEALRRWSTDLPDGFRWVSKVWERLTIFRFPAHARYGSNAGKDNPDFLNPALFTSKVLPAFDAAEVRDHCGPFVFQFPTLNPKLISQAVFLERLHEFLHALPQGHSYAVEIRNPDWLDSRYFQALNENQCAHCFNHWSYMPTLKDQMQAAADAGGLSADFLVARILTPLGLNYQQAVNRYKPYDQLKEPLPEMRRDVVRLAKRARQKKIPAYIIVNNRAEGNAPLTIDAIGRLLVTGT